MKENEDFVDDEYIEKWSYSKSKGVNDVLHIVTPNVAVNTAAKDAENFDRIPMSTTHNATYVRIVVVEPSVEVTGDRLMMFNLYGGQRIVVCRSDYDLPDFGEIKNIPVSYFKGESKETLVQAQGLRMMLICVKGETRQVFDLVGSMGSVSTDPLDTTM